MSMIILVGVAAILEGIYLTVRYYIRTAKFKHASQKSRAGHHAEVKTRLKYKLESIWDYLITPI